MGLLGAAEALRALPNGCSALAVDGRRRQDLWIVEAGRDPRVLISVERCIDAASWSPDGLEVAFSPCPENTDFAPEIVVLDLGGRLLGRFRIDKSQSEFGSRYVGQLEWREPRTLVTINNYGPKGGYMDVWQLAADFSGATRVRRASALGDCTVSPSMQYLACEWGGWGGIAIHDTLGPQDEEGVVEDEDSFDVPPFGTDYDSPEGFETVGVWGADDGTLYGVAWQGSERTLTTVEKSSDAAGGWRITDRELVGVDSPVSHLELDPQGRLLLSDGEQAYRVDLETASPRAPVEAHPVSSEELREPVALEITTGERRIRLEVLDTYCATASLR